jgi:putative iron-regulated protein
MKNKIARSIGLLSVLTLAGACGAEDEKETDSVRAASVLAVPAYSDIVLASYEDSLEAALELQVKVEALLADPSDGALEDARRAWLDAREPYLQTEVYRFYDGPIDNPENGPEGLINAWPLDEAYIDYVEGEEDSGIINDLEIEIDEAALEEANEQGGEENIATGFHAVEFLLWGQDLDEDGPGARPYTDYVEGEGTNADRRADYLRTVTAMLQSDLEGLVDAWAKGESNYRKEFEDAEPNEGVRRILTGMIVLSGFETGGERLQAALDSGSQEDEHSCFSDNTHRDMIQDIRGIENVWTGVYVRTDGSKVNGDAVSAVIDAADPDLADTISEQIDDALSQAEGLETPFDHEISLENEQGRKRVQDLVISLRDIEESLERAFELLELEVPDPG